MAIVRNDLSFGLAKCFSRWSPSIDRTKCQLTPKCRATSAVVAIWSNDNTCRAKLRVYRFNGSANGTRTCASTSHFRQSTTGTSNSIHTGFWPIDGVRKLRDRFPLPRTSDDPHREHRNVSRFWEMVKCKPSRSFRERTCW